MTKIFSFYGRRRCIRQLLHFAGMVLSVGRITPIAMVEGGSRGLRDKRPKTSSPTVSPSHSPSVTFAPSFQPSAYPSLEPSQHPSGRPSSTPSTEPSSAPSARPTIRTLSPSANPTGFPSSGPTAQNTLSNTQGKVIPSGFPTTTTSYPPSAHPSDQPSNPKYAESAVAVDVPNIFINFELTPPETQFNNAVLQDVLVGFFSSNVLGDSGGNAELDLEFDFSFFPTAREGTVVINGTCTGMSDCEKLSLDALKEFFGDSGIERLSELVEKSALSVSITSVQVGGTQANELSKSIGGDGETNSGDSNNVKMIVSLSTAAAVLAVVLFAAVLLQRRNFGQAKHDKCGYKGTQKVGGGRNNQYRTEGTTQKVGGGHNNQYRTEGTAIMPCAPISSAPTFLDSPPGVNRDELPCEVETSPPKRSDGDTMEVEVPSAACEVPRVRRLDVESDDESDWASSNHGYSVQYLNGREMGLRPPLASSNSFSSLSSGASGLLEVLNDLTGSNNALVQPCTKRLYNPERLVRVIRSAETKARSLDARQN